MTLPRNALVLLEASHAPEPEQAREQRHQLLYVEVGRCAQPLRNEINALPYRPRPFRKWVIDSLL